MCKVSNTVMVISKEQFLDPPPFHFKCGYHVYHMDIIGLVAAAPSPLAAAARPRKIVLHISKVIKKN